VCDVLHGLRDTCLALLCFNFSAFSPSTSVLPIGTIICFRPSYKKPDFFGIFQSFTGFLENYRIFRDFEGFLQILVNIFKVFCLFVTKKLETWKSFVTSDPEAFVCNGVMPPQNIGQQFYP